MKISFFGTTTLLFDDGKDQILFDAHFTRPGIFKVGFTKLKTDKELIDKIIKDYKIDRLRAIFISHTHYDHTLDVVDIAQKTGANIYGSESCMNLARGGNIPENKLHSFENSMHFTIEDFDIQIIPSVHSEARWYNDDLGETIDEPKAQPISRRGYKEGGSFDFFIKHQEETYLIRPSFNYIPGQLDGIKADVMYLGIAGLSTASDEKQQKFYQETIEKVEPKLIIPVHWDNFFSSLEKRSYIFPIPGFMGESHFLLTKYCTEHDISTVVQLPNSSIVL